jgi:type II secretory pathway pseudopilin PulG
MSSSSNLSNLPPDEPEVPKSASSKSGKARAVGASAATQAADKAKAQAKAAFAKMGGRLGQYMTAVDPLIAIVVLALLTTFALPIIASSRRAANEQSAQDTLRSMIGIQGRFRDTGAADGRHRFATSFFELAAAGLIDGIQSGGTELRRDGYLFHLGTPDDPETHYFAVALPEQWGQTGDHAYYIDDTTKLRVSTSPSIGPVFPEVN